MKPTVLSVSHTAAVPSQIIPTLLLYGIVCALSLLCVPTAFAQGTAFTHQGRLEVGGSPATGAYDFQFSIFGAASGGAAVAGPAAVPSVTVAGGLFTVRIDFGPGVFTGPGRWLEMGVRPSGSGGAYTTLSPRQELTPSPYAIFAASASTASGVAASAVGTAGLANDAVTSAKITDGTIVAADLSASLLGNSFWKLTGNAGTTAGVNFLGTTDNRALDLRVNGSRAFLLQPGFLGQHSVIGGPNQADVNLQGATVAGGYNGIIHRNAHYATLGGGSGNIIQIDARYSTVSGGHSNWILTNATHATIGGGRGNTIQTNSTHGTISGGAENSLITEIIVAEEFASTNAPHYSTIGGGELNVVNAADWATVPGGRLNVAGGDYSFAAGRRAKARNRGSFVWADSTDADFASTGFNQFLIRAAGGVGINTNRPQQALHVNGGYALIEGDAHEQAYIGGDGFTSDVQIGSLNPAIERVTLYNPSSDRLMDLTALGLEVVGNARIAGRLFVGNLPFGDRRNVQYDQPTGQFFVDDSTRRHKENIRPLKDDFARLLEAQPKTYTRPGAPDFWEIGLIAEELDELGLKQLVDYDSENRPDGIKYDKLPLYLLEVAKVQREQIQALNTKLETFAARLATLESNAQSPATR